MAVTYEAIATQTLTGTVSTVTFSSIPQTYTDLILISNMAKGTAGASTFARFNSDTSGNTKYSDTYMYGNGSGAYSGRQTNTDAAPLAYYVAANTSMEQVTISQIMNYSNSTTYKTMLSRSNRGSSGDYPGSEAVVSLWRDTSAITKIDLVGYTFLSGCTFTLYGIKAA